MLIFNVILSKIHFQEEIVSGEQKILEITIKEKNQKLILNQNKVSQVKEFNEYREKMNERIMSEDNLFIKRFYNLDTKAYQEGALPVKTKELLGLVASMVLRCDDCIKYHLGKCYEEGVSDAEVWECFEIANLVGGSIVIPHFRRAVEYWDELKNA